MKPFVVMAAIVPSLSSGCASSPPAAEPAHHGHHGQGFQHGFEGAEHWAKVFDDPAREAWQQPEAIIDRMALAPGSVVADVGAGTGYFAVRIARRVPGGRVYATDVEPDMVRYLGDRARREGLAQITPVLATADDAKLPESVDVVLIVDTLHHISGRPAYLQKLRTRIKDGGRLFVVDFKLDAPMGPPREHRLAPPDVVKDAEQAGFRAVPLDLDLPNQYVLAFVNGR